MGTATLYYQRVFVNMIAENLTTCLIFKKKKNINSDKDLVAYIKETFVIKKYKN